MCSELLGSHLDATMISPVNIDWRSDCDTECSPYNRSCLCLFDFANLARIA